MIRRSLLVLAVCAPCLFLAACGQKKDDLAATPKLQKVTLMLDYLPNADHAPIYAAIANGAFRKAGLEVTLRTPPNAASPLTLLGAGKADLAISYEPELLLARDKGAKIQGVGALVTQPLTSIISLGSANITAPKDLAGKTVSTAGIPYQAKFLQTILDRAGVAPGRVKQVNVNFNLIPSLLGKRADATLGAYWNYEGVQLQQAKKNPSIIKVQDAGVPTYDELVFMATEKTVRDRGEMIRRFIQAMQSGARAVQADPAAGVGPLIAANPDLKEPLQTASVKATLPVFFPARADAPYGYMDPAEWQKFGEWMRSNGLLKNAPNSGAFTNEFLPGEGGQPSESDPGDDSSTP